MRQPLTILGVVLWTMASLPVAGTDDVSRFRADIQPILQQFCYDCHADGMNKGGVAFDEVKIESGFAESRDLWWKALKNVRAGMMPPHKKPQPTREQRQQLVQWIKTDAFRINPADPDPGQAAVRRLNRVEYRNTVRDLTGVNYDVETMFPPDDSGHGFDNISDVLTLPPMLLEKYLIAARTIVNEAVPTTSRVAPENVIHGRRFQDRNGNEQADGARRNANDGPLSLSYYKPAAVSNTFRLNNAGQYQFALALRVNEKHVDNVFDYNRCRFIFRLDGRELLREEYSWQGGKPYYYDFNQDLPAGDHLLEFELQPLTPDEKQTRTLALQITSVTVRGPMAREYWVRPKNYGRYFPRDVPEEATGRRAYARELLAEFARKAFRRPVDATTVDRLTALTENVYGQPGKTFEEGVAQGMVATLASPRFLFREEAADPVHRQGSHAFVDEYALASRLSYFLWSSMPDEELFRLAGDGKLRSNLASQAKRMLADRRSEAFIRNFAGQWLQARDIESVPIEARAVLAREVKPDPEADRLRKRFRELNEKSDELITNEEKVELQNIRTNLFKSTKRPPRPDLDSALRRAMRQETEQSFDYILREDRSLLELIDCDYTFLNERLARHYGITNVLGDEMRRVALPPDSPRGGILTQGTVLIVTSNPTRTSPVKRGVFILDNILGTPPPPPPPNLPPLEDAAKGVTNRAPSLREMLALHRADAVCSSCHNRMDPLGLAFENFNALGLWRDQEREERIDASGTLITGESFTGVKELKRILARNHATDFYRTMTEKMLTYALGRGLEYYDVETVDQIVARMEQTGGRPSALLMGIMESAPFQKIGSARMQTAGTKSPASAAPDQGVKEDVALASEQVPRLR